MTRQRSPSVATKSSRSNGVGRTLHVDQSVVTFPVGWVPIQTARAICPDDGDDQEAFDAQICVIALAKLVDGENPQSEVEDGAPLRGKFTAALSVQDWQYAIDAWAAAGLPPLMLPMLEADFEAYYQAFELYGPEIPYDFELEVFSAARGGDRLDRIRKTQSDHTALLRDCIARGLINPRDSVSNVPRAGSIDPTNVLTYEDLEVFAEALNIKVDRRVVSKAYWGELPLLEQKRAILREFAKWGGKWIGNSLSRERSDVVGRIAALDGRSRWTIEEHLVSARKEQLELKGIRVEQVPKRDSSVFNMKR